MVDNSFLDKSIIIGYIFLSDPHHVVCHDYIHNGSTDYYATEEVETVYQRRKDQIISEHKDGIYNHIEYIVDSFEGELSEEDISEIRENIGRYSNPAWRYLLDYYNGKAGVPVYQASRGLRELLRDFEQRAGERQSSLYDRLNGWIRFATYESLQDRLQMLVDRGEEEDMRIILDAHDVGMNLDGMTELASANPKEFDDSEVVEVIENHTAIDNVALVFVERDYEPGSP